MDVYTGANVCCLHAEFVIVVIKSVREDSIAVAIHFYSILKNDGLMTTCIAGDCSSCVCVHRVIFLRFLSLFLHLLWRLLDTVSFHHKCALQKCQDLKAVFRNFWSREK